MKGVECLCFIQINENPHKNLVDDCVIRAIATATGRTWDDVYLDLMIEGFTEKNYPNYNSIWWSYLANKGWIRFLVKDTCPLCYTLKDFTRDHKYGIYLVGDGRYSGARGMNRGYSRNSERENMRAELDDMLTNARDDREAETIRKIMNRL